MKKRNIVTLVVLTTRFILALTPAAYVQTNARIGGKNDTSIMAMAVNKTGEIANQTSKEHRLKMPT